MKVQIKTLALIISMFTIQSWADSIPDGNYQGQGLYQSRTETGNYSTQINVQGNSIKSAYTLPDGSKKEWNFEMSQQANGFFKVVTNGVDVGEGYCLQKTIVCHYEIKVNTLSLEETFTLLDGRLYRFGSKDNGSGRVMWQEVAERYQN
jgi:hypothetical protein